MTALQLLYIGSSSSEESLLTGVRHCTVVAEWTQGSQAQDGEAVQTILASYNSKQGELIEGQSGLVLVQCSAILL